jgi:uncharacterized protein DUF5670
MLVLPGGRPSGREATMLETVIVVLLVLWLLGFFGRRRVPRLRAGGNLIHLLLVIILVLIVVRLVS